MSRYFRTIQYLFCAYLFLLPWQTRLIWHDAHLNGFVWEYGRFSLYGSQLLLWLILLLFAVWLIKNRPTKLGPLNFFERLYQPANFIYWLIILFVITSGLSIFWALDQPLAYYRWFIVLQSVALLALVLLSTIKFKLIAWAVVAAGIVQGLVASWQFITQAVWPNKWLGLAKHLSELDGTIVIQTATGRWLRAYGSLSHPNVLGGFLVICFLFLVYLAVTANSYREKILVVVGEIVIIAGLFFSFSRSAWLALIVGLVLFGWWLHRARQLVWQRRFFKLLLVSGVILVALFSSLPELWLARWQAQAPVEVSSLSLRLTFTQQAWQLIQLAPWQGTGIGHYTLGVVKHISSTWPGYYYQPVHNLYLLVLAELGVIGFIIFCLIIFSLFWFLARKIFRGETPDDDIVLARVISWLCFIAILIISLVDHYFWSLEFGVVIFWLILALNIKVLKSGIN